MGVLGPDAAVRAPERTPPLHGLIATASQAPDPVGTRWEMGFEFGLRGCTTGGIWVPCATIVPNDAGLGGSGSGSGEQTKAAGDARGIATFIPYVVWDEFTCVARDFQAVDYEQEARLNLDASKHKQIEHEFWTGEMMAVAAYPNGDPVLNMSLAATTPDVGVLNPGGAAAPTAVSPQVALALLQQGLANCGSGGRGMIHATPYLAELWGNSGYTQEVRGALMALTRGTYIVSGSGYPGTGPDVVTQALGTNEVWVFATGLPQWRTSDVAIVPGTDELLRQAMDRSINEVTVRAEQFAAVVWDECCTLAVLVDLCATGC